jgi:hypothetical protein
MGRMLRRMDIDVHLPAFEQIYRCGITRPNSLDSDAFYGHGVISSGPGPLLTS